MNITTDFSYLKKNNNLLYDIPVFISVPQLLNDYSLNLQNYNKIDISDKFLRDLSMYDYKNFNEFFENNNANNRWLIYILIVILFCILIFFIFF
jgi:hypothetical protein